MNARFQGLHLVVGIVTVLVFFGTGVYMRVEFPEAYESSEAIRYQYRANHVYVLFCGLVNLGFGLHAAVQRAGWRRRARVVGSWLLLTSPLWLVLAFFVEPAQAGPLRPLTFLGVLFSFAGVVLHILGIFPLQGDRTDSKHSER